MSRFAGFNNILRSSFILSLDSNTVPGSGNRKKNRLDSGSYYRHIMETFREKIEIAYCARIARRYVTKQKSLFVS